ncbi:IS4 family transposase [Aquimarina sp. I32.4]|uniref:IS4 family transposase n=1 Tax=Aquimarina sp. I32.4 TaxID=2053903 RepID=UPI000CDE9025|nr:IS4 family transposase [Aquimarina sp. I32.4]
MVEANVNIIEELKAFLSMVCDQSDLRNLMTMSPTDFSRERKLTLRRVVGIIINMPKRSLSIELQQFFDSINFDKQAATKGAFSLQRGKLLPLFFEAWNRLLVDCFYHYYEDNIKRWRGFRLQAVDGSTAYLIDKPDIVREFGTQDNQYTKTPMAQVMQLQDVLNDITIWGAVFPIKQGEQPIFSAQVSSLYEDSLTLFDRGYPSYALMYLMLNQETPRHFVMRCKISFNKEIKEFVNSDKVSQIVALKPTKEAIATLKNYGYVVNKNTSITIRLVKVVLSTGEIEVLLTNLYDEQHFTPKDFKYLYDLRWKIETTYGIQKNQQQMEQFSGHRVICIQQDYAAGLFVANLQSLIEKQCEPYLKQLNKSRKYDYKINKNVSWASLKYTIVKLFLENDPKIILIELQNAFQRNVEPIRPGRQYQRHRKAKRINGKYQTLTNYKRAI